MTPRAQPKGLHSPVMPTIAKWRRSFQDVARAFGVGGTTALATRKRARGTAGGGSKTTLRWTHLVAPALTATHGGG